MTNQSNHALVCERIRSNPKFQRLSRQRARLAWSLSAAVLCLYYSFIMVVAFAPAWLHLPLHPGSSLSIGLPVGAAVILFSWLLTACYVQRANSRFDALSAQVIEESRA
ncbi:MULTISPECIES: DUF485 domain-containing protein [Pseudomonas aeruginosa group]|uniref:DUF485 domain-containing protein n=1 Tax=Pseudomonas aeruginosa group TaxID=136841 RepID=UPI0005BD5A33|nr:DUF485 domain-containing protein [Pseudomonas aeruginosa]AYW41091.1 DUF485 domain-containing protein [Pseudomonas aeruginosa]